MEILCEDDFELLSNPGVASAQLLSPRNSASARVTITRVTIEPGAGQPRHLHEGAEQTWVALSGSGELLLADNTSRAFEAGWVVRFAPGDIHGFENTGTEPFIYLAVTSPPIDFTNAYRQMK